MRKTIKLMVLVALSAIYTSCQKDSVNDMFTRNEGNNSGLLKSVQVNNGYCNSQESDFLAGQNTVAGTITVANDNDSIYVIFTTTGGWIMNQTHLFVGNFADMPKTKKGNPQIGKFPYSTSFVGGTTKKVYSFAKESFADCFIVAAHADVAKVVNGAVVQSETAWGAGNDMGGGSWATYIDYCTEECSRIVVTEYDIFGGQTIPVGTLSVWEEDGNMYFNYSTNEGWMLSEAQLYVGLLENLPTNKSHTPIPGQFTYNQTLDGLVQTFAYVVPVADIDTDGSGCFIIAAHGSYVPVDADGNAIGSSHETGWSYGTQFPNTNRWGWYSTYCN